MAVPPVQRRFRRAAGPASCAKMIRFLLWCILLVLCWPLAVLAFLLYPLIWLVLLPFRIAGIAVTGVLQLIWALFALPARLVRKLA